MSRSIIAAMMVLSFSAYAQNHEWTFAVVARGNFTTTSRIYPNPEATSNDLRAINTPFNSILNGGIEIRAKWRDDNFFFYLSTEYFSESRTEEKVSGSTVPARLVPVQDGYRVLPFEIGMQVYVPIGSRSWNLSMGGGVGAYYTERILREAGANASPVGNLFGFGIHVDLHAEYKILPGIAVLATMKFRDPEVNVRNKFDSPTTTYNNEVLTLKPGEIPSRINIDGMTLGLGLLFEIL